jgi:uncharacterized protein (DUF934 family)
MKTKIWRETGFVANDPWIIETDEVKANENQKPFLGLDELITRAEESNKIGFGVLIKPADDVTRLEPYLYRLEIVAVAFPAFNDGRAFSHASLLRQRLGYANELRAVGDVLIDQIPLMLRVGIDSFAVTNETALKRLAEHRLPGIPHHYQPAARSAAGGKGFSWRRQSKTA